MTTLNLPATLLLSMALDVDFLYNKGTLLSWAQFVIYQDLQILFCKPLFSQPEPILYSDGVTQCHMQDFAFAFVEFHEAPIRPFLWPKVPLNSSPAFHHTKSSSLSLVSPSDFLKVHCTPSSISVMKTLNIFCGFGFFFPFL